jgi:uncharacterized protein YjdB
MTQDEIEHMWKVASNDPSHDTNWHDPVVIAFAKLVAAKERGKIKHFLTATSVGVQTRVYIGDEEISMLKMTHKEIRAREQA